MLDGDPSRRVWEPLADQPARPEEVDLWRRRDPEAGLGVIMGNGLVVMDVDDWLFNEFIKPYLHLLDTWVDVTGRGFVHVFLRTDTPPRNGRLLHPEDGRKLADIRYTHAYVGAPPSHYRDHDTVGHYAILHHGPEHIRAAADADAIWDELVRAYCQGPPRRAVVDAPVAGTHERTIQPPLAEDSLERKRLNELLHNYTGSLDLKRRLERGYDLADFPGKSHSEVDWMTCKELVKHNWTDEEITWAYRTLLIGAETYQNRHRPDHGDAYLQLTLGKARADATTDEAKLKTVDGRNFHITRVVKVLYPGSPEYHVSIVFNDGKVGTAKMDWREYSNVHRFVEAILRDVGPSPLMQEGHLTNNGFRHLFLNALYEVTEEVTPPPEATEPGQLERMIKRVVGHYLTSNAPVGHRYGWYAGDQAYIPHETLQAHIDAEPRGRLVKASQIANVMRAAGANWRKVTADDQTVRVWVVDAAWLRD